MTPTEIHRTKSRYDTLVVCSLFYGLILKATHSYHLTDTHIGTCVDGWLLDVPTKWPNDPSFEDDVEGAVECFKRIKRQYYFENIHGHELFALQPDEIKKTTAMFTNFDSQKKKIKERLVRAINKLFLPSSDDKKQLHILYSCFPM